MPLPDRVRKVKSSRSVLRARRPTRPLQHACFRTPALSPARSPARQACSLTFALSFARALRCRLLCCLDAFNAPRARFFHVRVRPSTCSHHSDARTRRPASQRAKATSQPAPLTTIKLFSAILDEATLGAFDAPRRRASFAPLRAPFSRAFPKLVSSSNRQPEEPPRPPDSAPRLAPAGRLVGAQRRSRPGSGLIDLRRVRSAVRRRVECTARRREPTPLS